MKRYARDNESYHPKPVERIELEEKHFPTRLVLTILFALIGVAAFVYGITALFSKEEGFQEVKVSASADINCGEEFVFLYDFSAESGSVRAELKRLQMLYSDAAVKAYQLFDPYTTYDTIRNLAYISDHPGEAVLVDDVLYQALKKITENDLRLVYLAPVYEEYITLYSCENDWETEEFDPAQSLETAGRFAKYCSYAASDDHVRLAFSDDHTVTLILSDEYRAFAASNDAGAYLDFGWLKNAFIIDYFAELFTVNGFTDGTISSYDGFVRNLDARGTIDYQINVFDKSAASRTLAAAISYNKPISGVILRSFAVNNSLDRNHYYTFADGHTVTPYIDPKTGLYKAPLDSWICLAENKSCSETALSLIEYAIDDAFDQKAPEVLKNKGIESVFCLDNEIWCTDKNLAVQIIDESRKLYQY